MCIYLNLLQAVFAEGFQPHAFHKGLKKIIEGNEGYEMID